MPANEVSREILFLLQRHSGRRAEGFEEFITQYPDAEKGKERFRNCEYYLECEFTILTAFDLCVRPSSSAKRNS
jgi:hypothetical protein